MRIACFECLPLPRRSLPPLFPATAQPQLHSAQGTAHDTTGLDGFAAGPSLDASGNGWTSRDSL